MSTSVLPIPAGMEAPVRTRLTRSSVGVPLDTPGLTVRQVRSFPTHVPQLCAWSHDMDGGAISRAFQVQEQWGQEVLRHGNWLKL